MAIRHNVSDRREGYIGPRETSGSVGIDIGRLTDADKERQVIFHHHHGDREAGVISSWNDRFVFVRFTMGSTAAACDPGQLEFAHSESAEAAAQRLYGSP